MKTAMRTLCCMILTLAVAMAAIHCAPAGAATSARAGQAAQTVAAKDDADDDAEPSAPGRENSQAGSFSIQLGYATDETGAARLRRLSAQQLGLAEKDITIRPSIKTANPTYLIVLGTFSSRDEGRSRCRQLKLSENECWVINNISK